MHDNISSLLTFAIAAVLVSSLCATAVPAFMNRAGTVRQALLQPGETQIHIDTVIVHKIVREENPSKREIVQ